MIWNIYLRAGQVYVPTVARTEAGFYLNLDPTAVVPVSDGDALRRAIKCAINAGNENISTPALDPRRKSVLLKYAKVKSWAQFERGCLYWVVEETRGIYRVIRNKRRANTGWEDDPSQIENFPPGTEVDEVAEKAASIVQSALSGSAQV